MNTDVACLLRYVSGFISQAAQVIMQEWIKPIMLILVWMISIVIIFSVLLFVLKAQH